MGKTERKSNKILAELMHSRKLINAWLISIIIIIAAVAVWQCGSVTVWKCSSGAVWQWQQQPALAVTFNAISCDNENLKAIFLIFSPFFTAHPPN